MHDDTLREHSDLIEAYERDEEREASDPWFRAVGDLKHRVHDALGDVSMNLQSISSALESRGENHAAALAKDVMSEYRTESWQLLPRLADVALLVNGERRLRFPDGMEVSPSSTSRTASVEHSFADLLRLGALAGPHSESVLTLCGLEFFAVSILFRELDRCIREGNIEGFVETASRGVSLGSRTYSASGFSDWLSSLCDEMNRAKRESTGHRLGPADLDGSGPEPRAGR